MWQADDDRNVLNLYNLEMVLRVRLGWRAGGPLEGAMEEKALLM